MDDHMNNEPTVAETPAPGVPAPAKAPAKEKAKKKETESAMPDVNDKAAAYQRVWARNYIPAFAQKCAQLGISFRSDAELAHALQLNGKIASMVASGVNLDTLVNAVVTKLAVKHASEGGLDFSIRTLNATMDDVLADAKVAVASHNKAAAADLGASVSDSELSDFLTISE